MAGSIVLGSFAVSVISADVLLYISVAIKASFIKFDMCNICKNKIAEMLSIFFSKFQIFDLIEVFFYLFFFNFVRRISKTALGIFYKFKM